MFGISSLSGPLHAATLIGIVLVEALVLHVGYGSVFKVAGDEVISSIEDQ
ncbi:MAG: hypothetical protein ABEJ76_04715 [Halanaeroarchaeum sp.]